MPGPGPRIPTTIRAILQIYKSLPCIAFKHYSKYYLLPQYPKRIGSFSFRLATNAIHQHSEKYNQYFSSQKLWEKVSHKYEQKIQEEGNDPQKKQEHNKKIQEFLQKRKEYHQKYLQPLRIIGLNGYKMFLLEYFQKKKDEKELRAQQLKKQQAQSLSQKYENNDMKTKSQDKVKKTSKQTIKKKIYSNIEQYNSEGVNKKWQALTPQQKQKYNQKYEQFRQQHQPYLSEFILNHEVPVLRRYNTISRFILIQSGTSPQRVGLSQTYAKYRSLSQQQKDKIRDEVKQLNLQSKLRYQKFLKKWKLSKQELKYLIQLSDQLRKLKKQLKAVNKTKKAKLMPEDDEDYIEDFDQENVSGKEHIDSTVQKGQQTSQVDMNNSKDHNYGR